MSYVHHTDVENLIFHNHKGGSGKTTLAVHTAYHLDSLEVPTVVLDLDTQDNATRWLSEYLWNGEKAFTAPGHEHIKVVSHDVELALHLAEKDDAILIVDTPPSATIFAELPSAIHPTPRDLMIVPVNGRMAADGAVAVLEEIGDRDFGCRSAMILNQTDPKRDTSEAELDAIVSLEQAFDDLTVYRTAIPRNAKMAQAERRGISYWSVPYAERTHTYKALRSALHWIVRGASVSGAIAGEGEYALDRELQERLSVSA